MKQLVLGALLSLSHIGCGTAVEDSPTEHCGLYAYAAEVTEVYDGDTITADVDLGFSTWRKGEKLRLWGIDAPELRGETRESGLASRDALRDKILGNGVVVCTIKDKTGKYGRYLAEVYLDGENINEWMMLQNHAIPYGKVIGANLANFWAMFSEKVEYAPLSAPSR